VATNGDTTNIVVGQVAQKRFGISARSCASSTTRRALRDARPAHRVADIDRDRGGVEAVKSCSVKPLRAPAAAS
jgi:hypothetical protein